MSKPQKKDVIISPLPLLPAAVPTPGLTRLVRKSIKLLALCLFLLKSRLWSADWDLWFCCSSWYGRGCGTLGQIGSSSWRLSVPPHDTHRCVHADLPGQGHVGTQSFPWEWMTEQGSEKVDVGVMASCPCFWVQSPGFISASQQGGFASETPKPVGSTNIQFRHLVTLFAQWRVKPPWRTPFSCSVHSRGLKPTFCDLKVSQISPLTFPSPYPFPFPLQEERVKISGHSVNISWRNK